MVCKNIEYRYIHYIMYIYFSAILLCFLFCLSFFFGNASHFLPHHCRISAFVWPRVNIWSMVVHILLLTVAAVAIAAINQSVSNSRTIQCLFQNFVVAAGFLTY